MDRKPRSIVLYYSRKKGRRVDTSDIASWIGKATGSDMFRIETTAEYPEDDRVFEDRLRGEHWHQINPDAKRYLPSLQDYDVIFVGFPNWAGLFPRVILTFLEEYNLNGKTIVPFGINEVEEYEGNVVELKNVCVDANVEDGMLVNRTGISKKKAAFQEWAAEYVDS